MSMNQNNYFANKALSFVGEGGTRFREWYYNGSDYNVDWCAIFISYVAELSEILGTLVYKTAGAGDFARYGVRNGWGHWYEGHENIPKVGDIVSFTWNGLGDYVSEGEDKYFSDHVGIVYKVDSNYIYTVEGNSGNDSETSTVKTQQYPLYSGYINGYYRPNWDDSNVPEPPTPPSPTVKRKSMPIWFYPRFFII